MNLRNIFDISNIYGTNIIAENGRNATKNLIKMQADG